MFSTPGHHVNVLIIGNGFDLNLGLKTGYCDFIKNQSFTRLVSTNKLCNHLYLEHGLKNWIDIENELKNYEANHNKGNLKYEYNELCIALFDYLKSIDLEHVNEDSPAYDLIFQQLLNTDFIILDYNYTPVLSWLFFRSYRQLNERVIKVHGSLPEKQIIFGVEDSYMLHDPKNIFLKKSYSPAFVSHDISSILKACDNVIFFGHSLGETDHSDFIDFFDYLTTNNNDKRNITFYHYGDEGFDDLQMQLDRLSRSRLGDFRRKNNVVYIDSLIESMRRL